MLFAGALHGHKQIDVKGSLLAYNMSREIHIFLRQWIDITNCNWLFPVYYIGDILDTIGLQKKFVCVLKNQLHHATSEHKAALEILCSNPPNNQYRDSTF